MIEHAFWLTPEPSIKISDEYIPEYELAPSRYGQCGAKSPELNEKFAKFAPEIGKFNDQIACSLSFEIFLRVCNDSILSLDSDKDEQRYETESRSKDWTRAFADADLDDYFNSPVKAAPCTGCVAEKRTLQIMKPVCECRYERKIVKREEERAEWKNRLERLRGLEKETFLGIDEISSPLDTRQIVSGLVPWHNRQTHEVEMKPCVSGIADNLELENEFVLEGIASQTPAQTPVASQSRLNVSPLQLLDEEYNKLVLEKQKRDGVDKKGDGLQSLTTAPLSKKKESVNKCQGKELSIKVFFFYHC